MLTCKPHLIHAQAVSIDDSIATVNLTHAVTYTSDHTDTINVAHVIKTKKH